MNNITGETCDQNLKKEQEKRNVHQKIGDCAGDDKIEGTQENTEEDRKEPEQNVRIVPIIMHDGKTGGDRKSGIIITVNAESSKTQFETETHCEIVSESNELEIQSKLSETVIEDNKNKDDHTERNDILGYMKDKKNDTWETKGNPEEVYSSKSSQPMNNICIQIENFGQRKCPANEEEEQFNLELMTGQQKRYVRYKQVTPSLKSTKCTQKSKLEARSKNYDRKHNTMLNNENHYNLRECSLQDLNRDMQGISKRLEDIEKHPTGYTINVDSSRKPLTVHTYQTSTLPRRNKPSLSSYKSNISDSPQTLRKPFGNSLSRHSGPPVGHPSISLETLNTRCPPPTPHFGFFPKPETRPGAITPAYVTTRLLYTSSRNLTSDQHSEQNYEREDKNKSNLMSKSSFNSEPHTKSNTLPRKINQSPCSLEFVHDINNRYSFNEDNRDNNGSVSWVDFTNNIGGNVQGRMTQHIEKEKKNKMEKEVKHNSDKYFKTSKTYQIQAVKGIARDEFKLDNLNPFLVEEDESIDQESNKVTTATDEYWKQLTNQTGQEDMGHSNDACTQTDKNAKKNGCKVM